MAQTPSTRSSVTLERIFDATVDEVWELWTTGGGVEAWWGPDGFDVRVRSLDLRPGGEMTYVMTATAPDQVDFMKKAGMPLATEARLTFTEVDPPRRLAYNHLADFIPGVEPYLVATQVDLDATSGGVRMAVTIEAMHDQEWTDRALKGWENELDNLATVLANRDPTGIHQGAKGGPLARHPDDSGGLPPRHESGGTGGQDRAVPTNPREGHARD